VADLLTDIVEADHVVASLKKARPLESGHQIVTLLNAGIFMVGRKPFGAGFPAI
jgi:hypothetical protein